MSKRKLYITGDIDYDSYEAFSTALTELEQQNANKPVEVELASDGGEVYAALEFSARIRTSKCKIHITAIGNVASAAVIILATGHKRRMTKESWVMVHEESLSELSGSVTEMERETKQLRALETQWNYLLELHTTTTHDVWERLHKDTTYLTADDCYVHGLVDEVI